MSGQLVLNLSLTKLFRSTQLSYHVHTPDMNGMVAKPKQLIYSDSSKTVTMGLQ